MSLWPNSPASYMDDSSVNVQASMTRFFFIFCTKKMAKNEEKPCNANLWMSRPRKVLTDP